jgi:hypothetical protein
MIADAYELIHGDTNGIETYAISSIAGDSENVAGHVYDITNGLDVAIRLKFQQGPVKEVGTNGITSEALLAILIDRTQFLQDQVPCQENEAALRHMCDALANFEARTARRIKRQVEGTNQA